MPVTLHSISVVLLLDVPVYSFRDALCLPTRPEQGIYFSQPGDSQAQDFLAVKKNVGLCWGAMAHAQQFPSLGLVTPD